MPTLAVFGAAHVDRLVRVAGETIMAASNPGISRERPGGVGFNVARTAAQLGIETLMLSRVGNDAAGAWVSAEAARSGLRTALSRSAAQPTASYCAVLAADGALIIGIADMAIYDEIDGAPAISIEAESCPFWHVDANLPASALATLAAEAARGVRRISASAVSPAKAVRLAPLLPVLDVLFCNRGEAEMLTGSPSGLSVAHLARKLAANGVRGAVVSDGAAELAVLDGNIVTPLRPIPARSVVSANGAGDALAGGTLFGLVEGLSLPAAARLGLAAASLKLEVADPVRPDLTAGMLRLRETLVGDPEGTVRA